jgi:hypothetical protein
MATQIRINKTKDLQEVLAALHAQFKLLSDAEIVKLALSLMYALSHEQRIQMWESGLPTVTFSAKQQSSLNEGLKEHEEMKKKGKVRRMTAKEVMDELE